MGNFQEELEKLLNKFSVETDSNTPDSILASYLIRCLNNWTETTIARESYKCTVNNKEKGYTK